MRKAHEARPREEGEKNRAAQGNSLAAAALQSAVLNVFDESANVCSNLHEAVESGIEAISLTRAMSIQLKPVCRAVY